MHQYLKSQQELPGDDWICYQSIPEATRSMYGSTQSEIVKNFKETHPDWEENGQTYRVILNEESLRWD